MTIEQSVIERLRALPADKQQTVLDFVEFLERKQSASLAHRPLKGAWADLKIDLNASDVTQARREMWKNFPRDLDS